MFSLPASGSESRAAISGMAKISNRLTIDASGTVHLLMGKVELGQGIGTAMAQLVAEELDVDVSRIQLVPVNTDHSPNEFYTVTSNSVPQSGPPTRRAAATAREFLLERASKELGVPIGHLSVRDAQIILNGSATGINYWQLLENQQFNLQVSNEAPLKALDDYRVVGQSTKRLDIPGKVFGEPSFLNPIAFSIQGRCGLYIRCIDKLAGLQAPYADTYWGFNTTHTSRRY